MLKSELIQPYPSQEASTETLFSQWIGDIQNNPHISRETSGLSTDQLVFQAKDFFRLLLNAIRQEELQEIQLKPLEPVLKVWHDLLDEQRSKGIMIKDTAMLIFSLKTSLLKVLEKKEVENQAALDRLNQLLDIMGILTFEMYSSEQAHVIEQQQEQIKYLLDKELENRGNYILCKSPAMQSVYRAVGLILENDVMVLLEGESGTGKDVLANMIHDNSNRKNAPFVTLNCGAIPKELIESELFGHEKGSFTGAFEKRLGKFELAQNGTLLLDEIGELTLDMQVKLLRVLQNKEIERVGGKEKIKINVRIIAATNKILKEEVDAGRFRLDLYYRIHVFPIYVPPLRERTEDIPVLVQYFIQKYAPLYNPKIKGISKNALLFIQQQKLEGNIRELENIIQRAILLSKSSMIDIEALQFIPGREHYPLLMPGTETLSMSLSAVCNESAQIMRLDDVIKQAIGHALKITNGNIRKAASALGISRSTFYNKVKEYHIPLENS